MAEVPPVPVFPNKPITPVTGSHITGLAPNQLAQSVNSSVGQIIDYLGGQSTNASVAPTDVTITSGSIQQNTNTYAIWVSGWGLMGSGGGTGFMDCLIGATNITVTTEVWGNFWGATVAGSKAGFGFRVPAGYYWKVIIGNDITSIGHCSTSPI